MHALTPPAVRLRMLLASWPDVASRKQFGNDAWFVGEAMFASLTEHALVVRLPSAVLTEAFQSGHARPILSVGATNLNRWVEVALTAPDELLTRLITAARDGARHAHGTARRQKPPRARRRRDAGKQTPR